MLTSLGRAASFACPPPPLAHITAHVTSHDSPRSNCAAASGHACGVKRRVRRRVKRRHGETVRSEALREESCVGLSGWRSGR